MHLPTERSAGPAWSARDFPDGLPLLRERLLARVLSRVSPEGAIREPCHSRALESGLGLKLIDRTGLCLERRPALVAFLEARTMDGDPIERAVAHYALRGGPEPGNHEVERFLAEAPEFTGSRKRALLSAILAIFGSEPLLGPELPPMPLDGLHAWAVAQVVAARVILADALGRTALIADADVRLLLDTQQAPPLWEGNLFISLLVLHALARLPRTATMVRAGTQKLMALQRPDGGLPFILDEDNWCTVTGGVALAVAGGPADALARIAAYLVTQQQPAGGWAFSRLVHQTDVDCTSVALELLQLVGAGAADVRMARTIRQGVQSLHAVRGSDGGFPTYVPGGPSEACMTAAAVNALAMRLPEQAGVVQSAIDFLTAQQRPDGSFPPDWSKSRLHGLFRVLLAVGRLPDHQPLRLRLLRERAYRLLKSQQNADGGWGQQEGNESDPLSTSYGLIAACGQADPTPAVAAVRYLLASAGPDGSLPYVPDSIGPRPFTFRIPVLGDVFALLALGHLDARLAQRTGNRIPAAPPSLGAPRPPVRITVPQPAAPRAKLVDGEDERSTAALTEWSRRLCRCTRPFERHAALARATVGYVMECVQPDSTYDESLLIGKQTLVFFTADDHCTDQELRDYLRFLEGGAAWDSEIVAIYTDFTSELRARGMETEPFRRATIDLCRAILEERGTPRSRVTPDAYFRLRRFTIAFQPYFATWRALRHRRLGGPAAALWAELRMEELVTDVLWLTNDLGSMEQDLAPEPEGRAELSYLNIRHANHPGLPRLVEDTIELTNRLLDKAERRLVLLEEAAATMGEPRLLDFADFALWMINGNRRAVLRLRGRYPGARARMERLREL